MSEPEEASSTRFAFFAHSYRGRKSPQGHRRREPRLGLLGQPHGPRRCRLPSLTLGDGIRFSDSLREVFITDSTLSCVLVISGRKEHPDRSSPSAEIADTMACRCIVLALCAVSASAFQLAGKPARVSQLRADSAPQMGLRAPAAAAGAAVALMLANANPALTQAAVEPPAVVRASKEARTTSGTDPRCLRPHPTRLFFVYFLCTGAAVRQLHGC